MPPIVIPGLTRNPATLNWPRLERGPRIPARSVEGSCVTSPGSRPRFDLNPGWNLITFQVLPADGQASKVFSSIQSGHGASLFDAGNPAASHLKAAFVLHGAQVVGENTQFAWRALDRLRL